MTILEARRTAVQGSERKAAQHHVRAAVTGQLSTLIGALPDHF
jgi:hypothetical protein